MSAPKQTWFIPECGFLVGFEKRGAVDHLWLGNPGCRDVICRPLSIDDLSSPTLSAAYDAWLAGAPGPVGTPLEDAGFTPDLVEAFKDAGVESVECLADLNDDVAGRTRAGFSSKAKAKAYLASPEGAPVQPKVLRAIDNLQAQITELRKRLEETAR